MHASLRIDAVQRNGNLHIRLHGHFSPQAAVDVTATIAQGYQGRGNIFIHTAEVTTVEAQTRQILADQIERLGLPREHLYLTGSKGLDVCPEKIRVIVYEKREQGRCGRCRGCGCRERHPGLHGPAFLPEANAQVAGSAK